MLKQRKFEVGLIGLLFVMSSLLSLPVTEEKVLAAEEINVGISYQTHIQNEGWAQGFVNEGELSGSEGKGLRLEGIEIKLTGDIPEDLGIEYRTHIQNLGWESEFASDGGFSGSEGQGLRLEGIEIRLTGQAAENYRVKYRTHIQNEGWAQGWVYDGEMAGSEGKSLRLEAIEIVLEKKSEVFDNAGNKGVINSEEQLSEEIEVVEAPAAEETVVEETVVQTPASKETVAVQEPVEEDVVMEEPAEETATVVSVKEYGAIGNGVSDDTAAIQKALNQNSSVYIPDGTYLINVDQSLQPLSGQTITLSDNAVLQAIPTASESNAVILIDGRDNISISGGKIIGERNSHLGSSGEWGMGVRIIDGASNITVSDMTIRDCWGDGIYLGGFVGESLVSNVDIDNVVSDNNRRQGLSITYAQYVTVSNSIFKNTNGTSPESGIDIEPNREQFTRDIKIINTQCYGNDGVGLLMYGKNGPVQRVEVIDTSLSGNDNLGLALITASDLTFRNTTISNNWNGIEIRCDVSDTLFQNTNISENYANGIKMVAKTQSEGIENIIFQDSVFANNSQYSSGGADGILIEDRDSSGYIKNIQFKNSRFIDNQSTPTQRSGIAIVSSGNISGIVDAPDCIFSGNILGNIISI